MSAKSQKRRLARRYPKEPRASIRLDWSGQPADPVANLHRLLEESLAPVSTIIVAEGSEAHRYFHPESYYDRSKIRKAEE